MNKDEEIAQLQAEVERLLEIIARTRGLNHPTDAEWLKQSGDEGSIDYVHWINEQWWPEGATHVTIDKQGGCCWWKLAPVLAPAREYGWKPREHGGELIGRYYDSGMPFSGPKWRDSLRSKPQEVDDAAQKAHAQ